MNSADDLESLVSMSPCTFCKMVHLLRHPLTSVTNDWTVACSVPDLRLAHVHLDLAMVPQCVLNTQARPLLHWG